MSEEDSQDGIPLVPAVGGQQSRKAAIRLSVRGADGDGGRRSNDDDDDDDDDDEGDFTASLSFAHLRIPKEERYGRRKRRAKVKASAQKMYLADDEGSAADLAAGAAAKSKDSLQRTMTSPYLQVGGQRRRSSLLSPASAGAAAPQDSAASDSEVASRVRGTLKTAAFVSEATFFEWASTHAADRLASLLDKIRGGVGAGDMSDRPLAEQVSISSSILARRLSACRNMAQQTALHAALAAFGLHLRSKPARVVDDEHVQKLFATVHVLLDLGVDIGARDPSHGGKTALHMACIIAMPTLVTLLLERGADTNALDDAGYTPLHRLCQSSSHHDSDKSGGMMKKLLGAGCNPHLETGKEKTTVFLLVESLIFSMVFRTSQTTILRLDEARMRAAFNMLEALLHDSSSDAVTLQADVNALCAASSRLSFPDLARITISPLGVLVTVIVALLRNERTNRRSLAPDPKNDLALKSLLRAARLLLDFGAELFAPLSKKSKKAVDPRDVSTRGTILDVLIRNEVKLLILHPRIQRELDRAWGPDFTFDTQAFPGKLQWRNLDELGTNQDRDDYDARELRTLSFFKVVSEHWNSRRRLFCIWACLFLVWATAISSTILATYVSTGDGGRADVGISGRNRIDAFGFAESVRARVTNDEIDGIHFATTFYDISLPSEVWAWLQGPVLSLTHQQSSLHDKLVAPVRLRQFRSSRDYGVCSTPAWAPRRGWLRTTPGRNQNDTDDRCVARFSLGGDFEDRTPDSAGIEYETPVATDMGTTFVGRFTDIRYGENGGFVVSLSSIPRIDLPPKLGGNAVNSSAIDIITAADLLTRLKSVGWIDDRTAVVIVEAVLYNGDINRFAVCRFVAEFPVTGEVLSWHEMRIVKLNDYEQPSELITLVVELVLLALWFVGCLLEFGRLRRDRQSYVRDTWNIVALLSFIFIGVLVCIRIVTAILGISLRAQILVDADTQQVGSLEEQKAQSSIFDPFWTLAYFKQRETEAAALVLIVTWLSVFRFLRLHPDLGILLRIVQKELRDVSVFVFLYVVVLLGFAFAFHIIVGTEYARFRTIGDSIVTLLQVALGGDMPIFDFVERKQWLPFALWLLYAFTSIILLLNLLIAMLNQSYANVYQEASLEYLAERAKIIQLYSSALWKARTKKTLASINEAQLCRRARQEPAAQAIADASHSEEQVLRAIAEEYGVLVQAPAGMASKYTIQSGLMRIRGSHGLNWPKRFVVINFRSHVQDSSKAYVFAYFDKEGDLKPRGHFFLSEKCHIEQATDISKHEWCLKLSTPDRTFFFDTGSHSSMLRWKDSIKACMHDEFEAAANLDESLAIPHGNHQPRMTMFLAPPSPNGQQHAWVHRKGALQEDRHGVLGTLEVSSAPYSIAATSLAPGSTSARFATLSNNDSSRQPSTLNTPFSAVLIDLGSTRRLFPTACSIEFQPKGQELGPQQWVLQGTNRADAAAATIRAHKALRSDNPTVRASAELEIARAVVDLEWTTIFVHTRNASAPNDSVLTGHSVYHVRYTVPCWAALPTLALAKAAAGSELPGAFRYFRLMQVSANKTRPIDGQDSTTILPLLNAKVSETARLRSNSVHASLEYDSAHALSFCGLELYGGLCTQLSRASASDTTRSLLDIDGAVRTNTDESGRLEDAVSEADLLMEQAMSMGELSPSFFATLFRALRASMLQTGETTREMIRQRIDQQIGTVQARTRSIEDAVDYIRAHVGVDDYRFVFEDGGE